MRVEAALAEQGPVAAGGLVPESPLQAPRKGRGRQKKVGSTAPSAVQRLLEACKEVFADGGAGIVPSPDNVEWLRSVLGNIGASDVGLTQNASYFQQDESTGSLPITYLHIYECDKFSIGIFCLPPSGVIPLHNHPGMTVFSKILFGSMHIKSYDWINVPHNTDKSSNFVHSTPPPGLRLAKVKTDAIFNESSTTSVLYPEEGGNMHCFTARTSCAVLDVLGPPYSIAEEGRDCTYYRDYPYDSCYGDINTMPNGNGAYAWLEEKEEPNDFVVVGAKYNGPKILEQ
ncbi:plant cysteine oxidase 2-like isoform X2 [Curcuma longa]|uniref:plant cysteine oxidase 2-like isoform X2 n=1 Tax=Curcuma longa TaxID=136217 RepID=UPI003D9DEEFE